ncbi:hypothetical protein BaRGS_00018279 [Batillaria attramentaria]|uniref:ABC transporter domain-containing protein n=1 Tax=Batillaria attramentaria TaxID=370345 RepID=A0ABD0KTE4_9CAEN
MGFGNQLKLLVWKNFTLRRRQPVRVLVEIVFPLGLFLFLVAVRSRPNTRKPVPECHFAGKSMPSAGTIPFLQSYLCTFNNDWYSTLTEDEMPGKVPTFKGSVASTLLDDIETVLTKHANYKISHFLEDLETIHRLSTAIIKGTASTSGDPHISSFLKNPEQLHQTILQQNVSLTSKAINTLLDATLPISKLGGQDGDSLALFLLEMFGDESRMAASHKSAVASMHVKMCEEDVLLKIFHFGADASDLQAEMCELTPEERRSLIHDLKDSIDIMDYLGMTEGTESQQENTQRLESLAWMINDISQLESTQLLTMASKAVRENSSHTPGMAGWDNMNLDVGQLFCGPGKTLPSLSAGEQDSLKQSVNRPKTDHQATQGSHTTEDSGICQRMIKALESTKDTQILWHVVKPIVLGVLPYTPDTPAVRRIIKEANRTFESLGSLVDFGDQWTNFSAHLHSYLKTSPSVDSLRVFAASEACQNSIHIYNGLRSRLAADKHLEGRPPQLNSSVCTFLASFLSKDEDAMYTWRNASADADHLIKVIRDYAGCFRFDKFLPYTSEEELVRDGLALVDNNTLWGGLVFENLKDTDGEELPSLIKYKIRMNSDYVYDTRQPRDVSWGPGPRVGLVVRDMKYTTYGFDFIQDMVDHAIIRLQGNVSQEVGVIVQQFPYPCWTVDSFASMISTNLPMFMVIAWIYSVAMIVKSIVYEKEQRLKEVMKIMGLGNGVHWVAWFINAFVLMLLSVILLCVMLKTGKVFQYSDVSVIFVFMLSFTVATITQCFLISVFFSKANLAAVCGGFIYFVLFLPYTQLVQWEEHISTSLKMFSCISSNIAFGFGCAYIAEYERQALGCQWSNIGESLMPDDSFNLKSCIVMMLLDSVVYLTLTLYIEAVFPGQYGMPRKWYFPLQPSYWCGFTQAGGLSIRADIEYDLREIYTQNPDMEAEPEERAVGVAVRNLRKVYSNGKKLAVDDLTINFYEGQITSFLGHNGAGKTTTMSILTGLFPPTSGTAYIYGKNIQTEMDQIRQSLGVCPQHNVLFDLLTVEEHIWFYARLKGKSEANVQHEMTQMVKDVGLPHKRKEQACKLSGGMKRKLSVAIAFVGGSRTVILDEPTAGVDPYARRSIWELLLKLRKGRTIILSTHHMDEADVLGDRIAIISHGKLCCIGSSLFLKDRFGSGYYLTLVRGESGTVTASAVDLQEKEKPSKLCYATPLNFGDGFSTTEVTTLLQKFVPEAQLVEDNSMEVCFQMPESAADSGQLTALFAELEKVHDVMGVSSYGISDTSLEEVFLRVTEENDSAHRTGDGSPVESMENDSQAGHFTRIVPQRRRRRGITSFFSSRTRRQDGYYLLDDTDDTECMSSATRMAEATSLSGAGKMQVKGKELASQQMLALFLKRFHRVRRSKKGFVSEFLLPVGFVCLAMAFSMAQPPLSNYPPCELQPWIYEPPKGNSSLHVFYSNESPTEGHATQLEKTLLSSPYHGTRCMDPAIHTIQGYSCLPGGSPTFTAQPPLSGNITIDSPSCSCQTGWQRCPPGAGGPTPAHRYLPVNDILYNMTGRNISDWLVKTMEQYQMRRYGGFSFGAENRLSVLNATQIVRNLEDVTGTAYNKSSILPERLVQDMGNFLKYAVVQENAKVWYSNKAWSGLIAYMNSLNNVILRSYLPESKRDQYGIVTISHPMNFTKQQLKEEIIYHGRPSFDVIVAICVIFALSFVPASFVLFLIEERVSNSKHLQFVSGINPTTYWVTNFLWDMLNYLVPSTLCIIIFVAFGKDAYVSSKNISCLVGLLCLYGWAITPMMYPFSRLFSIPSSAFVALSCVNTFLGVMPTIATVVLELMHADDPELVGINSILKKAFLVLPHYCLGRGLIDMALYQMEEQVGARYGESLQYNLLEWDIVGRNLVFMLAQGVLFFFLNLLMEYNCFCKWRWRVSGAMLRAQVEEDVDVIRERERVLSGTADSDILQLNNLTKVYWAPGKKGKMTAVDHLCVGVPAGQCFGLLGVNGAGKTTTFKMLTGDVPVTSGDAHINGYSIQTDMEKVRQFMGYCPQFDALDPLLTGREQLEFYSRICGIPWDQAKSVANWAIERLGLTMYADKISSSYSGGNKRKLSTAIALIGNPPIIFLDEPTSGMDPKARRFLWNCINNIVKSGRSVILTSHSMEECEALCGRLAIMVNGTFKCIGSIQHLKNRFGDGYTIILRVSGQNPDMDPVIHFINSRFPQAILRERHHNMLQYQLGSDSMSLSQLFAAMEEAKKRFHVEDYSVSQTTLDEVFINFAKMQTDCEDSVQKDAAEADSDVPLLVAGEPDWVGDELTETENTTELGQLGCTSHFGTQQQPVLPGSPLRVSQYISQEIVPVSAIDGNFELVGTTPGCGGAEAGAEGGSAVFFA